MRLARIITNAPQIARPLLLRLESSGYTVEIVKPGEVCGNTADLEIELEKMPPQEALAQAARLSRGKQVNVFVAPGCMEAPAEEPQPVPLLHESVQAADQAKLEFVPAPLEVEAPSRWESFADQASARAHSVIAQSGNFLQRIRKQAVTVFGQMRTQFAKHETSVAENWRALRVWQTQQWEQRKKITLQHVREAETERARHSLQRQEELRHEMARKRLLEEERERQRQLEEQLRRVRQAEEAEMRQGQREAQLERQRLEALRLAEERERVARECAERERKAEEERRMRAEALERRRREREQQVVLQQNDAAKLREQPEAQRHEPTPTVVSEVQSPNAAVPAELVAGTGLGSNQEDSSAPVEEVFAYNSTEPSRGSRWEAELNSPYHPAWTWAAAAAGAVTVGIMLLWTAMDSGRSSAVQFAPLSPSSLLPVSASQIQQQVPFGPVKLVVHKAPPASAPAAAPTVPPPEVVVPASTSAISAPISPAPRTPPAQSAPKPSAVKRQVAISMNAASSEDSSDGADVVVRHFTAPAKAPVPQPGQTATIKHYSDLN